MISYRLDNQINSTCPELAKKKRFFSRSYRAFVRSDEDGNPIWGVNYFHRLTKRIKCRVYQSGESVFNGDGRLTELEIINGKPLIQMTSKDRFYSGQFFRREKPSLIPFIPFLHLHPVCSARHSISVDTEFVQFVHGTEYLSEDQWKDLWKAMAVWKRIGFQYGFPISVDSSGSYRAQLTILPRFNRRLAPCRVIILSTSEGERGILPGLFRSVIFVSKQSDGRIICGVMLDAYTYSRQVFVPTPAS